jgi:hypothetical protein
LPNAYDGDFLDELDDFIPHLERAMFKGGEPFLVPEYRRIWDSMIAAGSGTEVCVTTNGTVWNDQVDRYLRELRMDVIMSVDAVDADLLESIRVGVDASAFWKNVDRFQSAATASGAGLTLSMCLMRSNWSQLGPFLHEVERRCVNPNIVWVWVPSSMDLLRLPSPELATVLRELESQRGSAPSESPASANIWEEVLGRIRSVVERSSALELRGRAPSSASSPPLDETGRASEYRRRLSEAAPGEILVIRYKGDVVQSVDAPGWADFLHPEAWTDTAFPEFPKLLGEHTDGPMELSVEEDDGGAMVGEVVLSTPSAVHRLAFYFVPDLGETSDPGQGGELLIGLKSSNTTGPKTAGTSTGE